MPNMNTVVLAGHLTRDPELRCTSNGQEICKFGLAVGSRYKDGNEWKDGKTLFIDVTIWGASGKAAAERLRKGRPVIVRGRLELQQWESDGQKRSKHSVTADFWMAGVTRDRSGEQNLSEQQYAIRLQQDIEDEIPF